MQKRSAPEGAREKRCALTNEDPGPDFGRAAGAVIVAQRLEPSRTLADREWNHVDA